MVRPKAAQRVQFNLLKAQLGGCHGGQWQKAQCIMDRMCELVGVFHGPSRGLISPRACGYCDRFGHTRRSCPHLKDASLRSADSDIRQMEFEKSRIRMPKTREEATSEKEWLWAERLRELDTRFQAAVTKGLGCSSGKVITCASDIDLDCQCAGCIEWKLKF